MAQDATPENGAGQGCAHLPGYVLHPLKWHKPIRWAVTVRQNWRLTFRFEGQDAVDVDLEDYH